jgi:hypothetical protein
MGPVQLLAFQLPPGAPLEGQLLGAIERAQSGGTLRILEVLFVGRDDQAGELVAFAERERGQGGLVSALLGFRLDPATRKRATEKALRAFEQAGAPEALRRLAAALPPGGALAAVLVEHVWARAVEDAVTRTGGAGVLSEFVDEPQLASAAPRLLAALERAAARA